VLFSSLTFLGFFGIVAVLHYSAPARWRWAFLLLVSLYFYSTFRAEYVLLLCYAAAVAYGAGWKLARWRGTHAGRVLLVGAVVAELAALGIFKYFNFVAGSLEALSRPLADIALPRLGLVLPVGLSFFTFSCVSYLIDVHRGRIEAERHPGRLAVYVAFFPKLLAGPIERAGPFLAQLAAPARFDADRVAAGAQLMLWGLFKKVVIADRLAVFADAGFAAPAFASPVALVLAVYCYAFQIYCDFSGYSDIAIGAARVLGFDLMENFRRPYLARSVHEFWSRRWHISLMAWFRDYLYIPLGGSRVSLPRRHLNVLAVFLVSGLWHGANWTFVVWGGLNGLYQIIHAALGGARGRLARRLRLPAWLTAAASVLLTFHLIAFAWIFFRAASLKDAVTVITRIHAALPRLGVLARNYNWTGEFGLAVVLVAFLISVEVLDERIGVRAVLARWPVAVRWGAYYGLMAALLVLGVWGLNRFVYMQF
jgi:D-alanyl-lipoteichoic acid acyltransferase DltB (MBOAT superfamily)